MQLKYKNKINIGILGGGRIAEHHIKAIKSIKKFKLVCLSDLSRKKTKYYADKYKINTYDHYVKMLEKEKEVDIVVIMSPSGMHFEHSIQIIKKFKKHIILEKPPCMNKYQISHLYDLAKKFKIKIFPVFQNRHNKCIVKTKELIKKKQLGSIRLVNLSLRWCRPQRYYNLSKWRGTFSHDGGALTNQGIHYIDLLRHLFGEIKTVKCLMKTYGAKIEVEDSAVAILEFKNGALGSLEITTAARPKDYEAIISAVGSKGIVKIGGLATNILENYTPKPEICKKFSEKIDDVYGFGHFRIYEDVKDYFVKNKKYPIDYYDCLKTVELINSFYVSDEKKKKVLVEKSGNSSRLGKSNEKISKIYR